MAAEYLERMGARIRSRREELGMSRSEVARQMPGKTNEQAVYRWENGKNRPHDDTLEALAVVLDVPVAYFLAPGPTDKPADLLTKLGTTTQLDRIEHLLIELLARTPAPLGAEGLERELAAGNPPPRARGRGNAPAAPSVPRKAV